VHCSPTPPAAATDGFAFGGATYTCAPPLLLHSTLLERPVKTPHASRSSQARACVLCRFALWSLIPTPPSPLQRQFDVLTARQPAFLNHVPAHFWRLCRTSPHFPILFRARGGSRRRRCRVVCPRGHVEVIRRLRPSQLPSIDVNDRCFQQRPDNSRSTVFSGMKVDLNFCSSHSPAQPAMTKAKPPPVESVQLLKYTPSWIKARRPRQLCPTRPRYACYAPIFLPLCISTDEHFAAKSKRDKFDLDRHPAEPGTLPRISINI
jgi:hypothetical protein